MLSVHNTAAAFEDLCGEAVLYAHCSYSASTLSASTDLTSSAAVTRGSRRNMCIAHAGATRIYVLLYHQSSAQLLPALSICTITSERSPSQVLVSFRLTAGVCMRMQIFKEAQDLMPGGVNSPVRAFKSVGGTPVIFERVKGSHAFDVDGNECVLRHIHCIVRRRSFHQFAALRWSCASSKETLKLTTQQHAFQVHRLHRQLGPCNRWRR